MALLGAAGERAGGFSWYQYGGVNVVWPGGQSVRYLSPTSFPEGSDAQLLLLEGMGLWNLVPAADFEYFYSMEGMDYIDPYDGYNDTIAAELDPGVLAVTYMVSQGAVWYDMDQVYSASGAGVGWTFDPNPDCTTVTQPQTYGYALLLVATHELGHALGLGHDPLGDEPPGTPWFIGTMNPRYPAGGPVGQENIVEVHTDDRNGTRFLYPHSGPSEPPYVDLANAGYCSGGAVIGKPVPIFFTPAGVNPSGVVTARSVIENFGTTNEFYVQQGFYLSTDATIDTDDLFLGSLLWDIAFEDGFEFDVDIDMPEDLAAGPYYLGSILDDLNEVEELYEDNNAAIYCTPLTINRLVPVINTLDQEIIPCGVPYTGPMPTVTHPLNMNPITWSPDNPEPGMTINPNTGVISWPSPVRSEFLYTLFIRATNSAGSTTQTFFLGVTESAPVIAPLADEVVLCGMSYTGPTPVITEPACMNPIINWSLDAGPPDMTIHHDTGVVAWPEPVPSAAPYTITIRATNGTGNGTQTWHLDVLGGDMDDDGDVDLLDYDTFNACIVGPETWLVAGCECADFDGDGDVDLADFAEFTQRYEGSAPEGACCFANGSCTDGTPTQCSIAGGSYLGEGTSCATEDCLGACCFPSGFCLDLTQNDCSGIPGTFHGYGTACATTDCTPPPPDGACCHPDESCTEGTATTCAAAGGTYQGDDTTCAGSDCTIPAVGACCNPAGWGCTAPTEAACLAADGTYEGDDTTCAAGRCPEYRNDINPATTYYAPGASSAMGDDMTLVGTHRSLIYYDLGVYGGHTGGGPFNVTAKLYTNCPGSGGTLISGATSTWTAVPDDDYIYVLSADFSAAPVTIPNSVWMVVTFSTAQAGWVLAGQAEVGYTANIFGQNDPPWGCSFALGGSPPPYAGFWADLQCAPAGGGFRATPAEPSLMVTPLQRAEGLIPAASSH
ncbi:MAG: putative Ig domain-containing protein [Planctomycetota bacterium]